MDSSESWIYNRNCFHKCYCKCWGLFGSVQLYEYDYFCIQVLSKEKVFLKAIIEQVHRRVRYIYMNAVHTYSVRTTCVMYMNWIFQRNKRVTLLIQRVCRDFNPMFILLFSLYLIIKSNKFIFKYITVECHLAF